jgi:hypothetical protein
VGLFRAWADRPFRLTSSAGGADTSSMNLTTTTHRPRSRAELLAEALRGHATDVRSGTVPPAFTAHQLERLAGHLEQLGARDLMPR